MAKKFLTGLNLVVLDVDPATGSEGELYFNSSASVAKIYQAGSWSVLGAGGGGTTVSTTEPESPEIGDSWYKNDTGEFYIYDGTYWVEVNGVVGLTEEQVQEYVSPLFIHNNHTNITATYDNINNEILLEGVSAVSGSLSNIDSIVYPDYITFDTTPETIPTAPGSLFWDDGDSVPKAILNESVEIGIGQEQVALVKNITPFTIAKGKVVYINGAAGQLPTVAPSDADTEATSSKTLGITAQSIAATSEGFVTTEGILRGLNTEGLTEGGAIWLSSTAGNFTQTAPTQPAHSVFLGYVVKAHPSSGEIFVKIQNGYELEELHNVLISGSVQNNEILAYDLSNGLWINKTASEAGIATTLDLSNYLTTSSASTNYATKTYADSAASSASAAAVSYLVDSAPSTLDTLNELAAALGDDANFASTVTTALGNKLDSSTASSTYLTQTSASTTYQPIGSYSLSSHNHTLDSLSNVDINSLNDGDAIIWSSASSAWINQVAQGGATTTVSETAPESPEIGDSWYKPSNGSFFIYDGIYWVEVTSVITMSDEEAQDKVAPLFDHANHVNITASYDDANNQIILTSSATPDLSAYLTQSSASTIYATKAELDNIDLSSASAAAVAAIVDSAPATLDTLNELAAALGDDPNFATTITTSLGNKLSISSASTIYAPIASPIFTGNVTLSGDLEVNGGDITSSASTINLFNGLQTINIGNLSDVVPGQQAINIASNRSYPIVNIGNGATAIGGQINIGRWNTTGRVDVTITGDVDFPRGFISTEATIDDLFLTNPLSYEYGGTGMISIGGANNVLTVNPDGTALQYTNSPTFNSVNIGEAITKTTSTILTSASTTTIATFPGSPALSAECLVVFSSESSGAQTTSKILIVGSSDEGTVDMTEYAIIERGGFFEEPIQTTLSASFSGGNIVLRASAVNYQDVNVKVISTHILSPLGAS
jgi:hypothetical protein